MDSVDSSNSADQVQILRIRPNPRPDVPTKAYGDVLLWQSVTIRGVAIVASTRGSGFFISFPSIGKNGKFFAIVEIAEPLRSLIEKLLLAEAKRLGLI